VKELGIVGRDCPCLAADLSKIFSVYWLIGGTTKLPSSWPAELATNINSSFPAAILTDNIEHRAYFTSSPPPLSPKGRTGDIHGILETIRGAKKFIYISVMDYFPMFLYGRTNRLVCCYYGHVSR